MSQKTDMRKDAIPQLAWIDILGPSRIPTTLRTTLSLLTPKSYEVQ